MGFANDSIEEYIFILPQTEGVTSNDDVPDVLTEDGEEREEGEIYRLTATSRVTKTESSTVTQYPVSSGATIGDHYRINGTTIEFTGVITNADLNTVASLYSKVKGLADDATTDTAIQRYIKKIRGLMRGKEKTPLVTIYLPDGNGEPNCLITSMKITRDNKTREAYRVDITARKLLVATSETSLAPAGPEFEPEVDSGQESGASADVGPAFAADNELVGLDRI